MYLYLDGFMNQLDEGHSSNILGKDAPTILLGSDAVWPSLLGRR